LHVDLDRFRVGSECPLELEQEFPHDLGPHRLYDSESVERAMNLVAVITGERFQFKRVVGQEYGQFEETQLHGRKAFRTLV
jgi:hypothetical protein